MSGSDSDRCVDRLRHILEEIRFLTRTVASRAKSEALADAVVQRALVWGLSVIGEDAARLAEKSPDFVEQHPEINWKGMRGMRNRLIHAYYEIDWDQVWDTIQERLPELELQVARLLRELEGRAGPGGPA